MNSQNMLSETDLSPQNVSNYNSGCFVVVTGVILILIKVRDLILISAGPRVVADVPPWRSSGAAPALSLGADRVSQLSLSPLWQGLAPPHPMDFHLLSEEWDSEYCSCVPVARTPAVRNVSLGLRLGAWFLWDILLGRGWSCLKRHASVQDTGRDGERRWFVMQIPTMRMSKPGACLGKGDGFFFLRFCSEQNSRCSESLCMMWFVIFAVWTQWLLSSAHRLVSSSWWAVTLRSLKLCLTEGSALCSLCFFFYPPDSCQIFLLQQLHE